MTPRRFPPPWNVEELEACFVVKDASGQKLAPMSISRRSPAALAQSRTIAQELKQ